MIKYYNNEDFNKLTKEKVIVDFFATWCGPCKMLGQVLEKIENDIDIDIIKVDIDKYPELAREYKVMSVPTVLLFDKNEIVKQNIGFMDEKKFIEFTK